MAQLLPDGTALRHLDLTVGPPYGAGMWLKLASLLLAIALLPWCWCGAQGLPRAPQQSAAQEAPPQQP